MGTQTITYTYTDGNGCTASASQLVTVNTLPTITGNLSVCVGSTTTLTGSGTAASSNAWTSTATSVATVDAATGVVTGVSAGMSVITYTDNNGCQQTATVTVSVCCEPPTTLTYDTNPATFCAGAAITTNTATVNGTSPHTYSVSPDLPDGLTLNTTTGAITGTPTVATAATNYTITATNGCGFTTVALNIGVGSVQGMLTANGPFCDSGSGQLTWTASEGAGPFTIVYHDGAANRTATGVVSGTPFNVFTNPVTATTTYNLVSVTDANGCLRTSGFTGGSTTIIVSTTPTVNAVSNQSVCDGENTVAISFSGLVMGTSYNWTNNNTAIGLGASGSGNIGSFTATNTTNATITATITVTPVANGCTGVAETFTISVKPKPSVSISNNATTICTGGTTNIDLSAAPFNVSGTVFNWSRDNTTNVSGTVSQSGVDSPIAITLTHSETSAQPVTFTVTPVANGCTGDAATTTVNVTPDLIITAQPQNAVICGGGSAILGVTAENGTGTTSYQWQYYNGSNWANVTDGIPAGAVYANANNQNLSVAGITASGAHLYQCVISASGSGCDPVTSNSASVTVNTNAAPAFISPDVSVCANSEVTYTLNSTYAGYTWTVLGGTVTAGGGINDHTVTVNWGAAGSGSVSVSVTDGNTCSGTVSENITINARPTVTYCQSPDYCMTNEGSITLNLQGGTLPYSLSWSPNHGSPPSPATINAAGNFVITGLQGNTDYTFVLTDANGCSPQ